MQKAQTNLFPAFEGPEHQNLHTKGKECVCNPYFKIDASNDTEITHFRHQPLTEENKANPPAWLADAEREQNTVKITNEKIIDNEIRHSERFQFTFHLRR